MHKILFITFEFHPVQTTGNFRPAKFVKYFKEFGIEPVVMCGEEQSILQYFKGGKVNSNLNDEIPNDVTIVRVPFKKTYLPSSKYAQALYYADPISSCWAGTALQHADKILQQHTDIEAVFVTLPSFSIGEIAYEISRKYKLPLIVDLRDAWSLQGQFPYFTRIHYWWNKVHEVKLLKRAAAIITVTNELANIYKLSNPSIDSGKIHVVYNSFDNHKFKEGQHLSSIAAVNKDKFIIGYVGAFYYNITSDNIRKQAWWKRKGVKKLFYYASHEEWIYRSPYFLFKALQLIFNKHPDLRNKIFFGHVGDTPEWLSEMAALFGLQNNIITYGFRKVNELPELMNEFNALLATTEKIPGDKSFCLPSKTFDYIKYNKPIIGFVKAGDFKEFLEKSGMAVLIDPDQLSKDMEKLEDFLFRDQIFTPDSKFINQFHACEQTRKLSGIMKKLIKKT